MARDDQAIDLDLLPVLQMRQLADRLRARASEGIPPRRSQMPFQAGSHEVELNQQPRSVQVESRAPWTRKLWL